MWTEAHSERILSWHHSKVQVTDVIFNFINRWVCTRTIVKRCTWWSKLFLPFSFLATQFSLEASTHVSILHILPKKMYLVKKTNTPISLRQMEAKYTLFHALHFLLEQQALEILSNQYMKISISFKVASFYGCAIIYIKFPTDIEVFASFCYYKHHCDEWWLNHSM